MFKTINKSSTLYILAVVIFFLKISTFEEIFYTYGDDSWVLVGSNYTDVFDKVICCAFSQLGFSLFFQNLFLLAPSTDIYIKLLFFLFCFTSVIVVNYTNLNFNFYEKLIFLMLLYNSPMLMNYSLRSKPFVFESLITLFILGLLLKSNSINNIENKILVYFSIFIFFSLVTIIPITAFFFILSRKKILKLNKNLFSYIPFSIFVAIISFLSFLKKNSEIDLGWISYYAPSEGGIGLFFRWLYFSVIRIFTESNKLDLGASGFSTFVSVSLFLLGVYYLVFIKRNYLAFEFGLYIFLINIVLSILKIYTFGGSRANIYYMALVIYFISMGVVFLLEKLPINKNVFVAIFVSYTLFSINALSVSYSQTTRSFDQTSAQSIVEFINTSDDEILIYHGGLWTIGTYYDEKINLEELQYPFEGSGTNNMPVPNLAKDNHIIICTEYIEESNCFKKIDKFLKENNKKTIFLAALHYRDHQLNEYLKAFKENNYSKEEILTGEETSLIKYSK